MRSALSHILSFTSRIACRGSLLSMWMMEERGCREWGQGPGLYGLRQVIEPLSLRILVYKMGTEIRHCDED